MFLGNPTKEEEIHAAFYGADLDASGVLDFDEVAISIMGAERAQKFDVLTQLIRSNELVDSVSGAFKTFQGSLGEWLRMQTSVLQRTLHYEDAWRL